MATSKDTSVVGRLMASLIALATLVTIVYALPLLDAWRHDPSMRYGALCFLFWLPAVLLHYRRLPMEWSFLRIITLWASSVCLILGILGELQALVYFAFVGFFTLPVWAPGRRLFLCAGALLWMPIWVWLAGPYLGTSIAVTSLALALPVLVTSIILAVFKA